MRNTLHQDDNYADTLSRDDRRRAHHMMVEQFYEIIRRSQGGSIYWTGTKTDLMELTYEMFIAGTVRDSQGRPYPFKTVVDKVCSTLHVCAPPNPYTLVSRARMRKGVRQQPFFSRYCWLMFRSHHRNPLHTMLRRF